MIKITLQTLTDTMWTPFLLTHQREMCTKSSKDLSRTKERNASPATPSLVTEDQSWQQQVKIY